MTTPEGSDESGPSAASADLAAVLGVVALSLAFVAIPSVGSSTLRPVVGVLSFPALRAVVGALVVFVAPGYALVAALFPAGAAEWAPDDGRRLDAVERLVLGTGLSLATVGLLGLTLGVTGVGLEPLVVVGTTSAFTVAATVVAVVRRHRLPPAERYRVVPSLAGVRSRLEAVRSHPLDRRNLVVFVVAASTVVAAGGIGYAMTQRPPGETFTEFAILTENAEGELVADGYPTEFTRGESKSLVVAVGNHEHRTRSYTVVVVLVGEETHRLDRFSVGPLAAGETATVKRQVTPTATGDSLKLSFLLYRGDAPADPSAESAYREVHLWVDVTA